MYGWRKAKRRDEVSKHKENGRRKFGGDKWNDANPEREPAGEGSLERKKKEGCKNRG